MTNATSPVLRNVVVHDAPRALVRPVREVAVVISATEPYSNSASHRRDHEAALTVVGTPETSLSSAAQSSHEPYTGGYDDGFAKGMANAEVRIAAAIDEAKRLALDRLEAEYTDKQATQQAAARVRIQQLDRLLVEFERSAHKRAASLESDAAILAFEVACRFVAARHVDRNWIVDAIAQQLRELTGQSLLEVHLHPHDLEYLKTVDSGRNLAECYPHVNWLADPQLPDGDFRIETSQGQLEVRLTHQVERLKETWLAAVAKHTDETARSELEP